MRERECGGEYGRGNAGGRERRLCAEKAVRRPFGERFAGGTEKPGRKRSASFPVSALDGSQRAGGVGLCVLAQRVRLLQSGVSGDRAGRVHTAREHASGEPRVLEAFNPALQPADSAAVRVGRVVRGGGKQIHIAERVIVCVERIGAVEQRFHLAAHPIIINRRGEHEDVGLLHLLHDGRRVVADHTALRLLAGQTAHPEAERLAAQTAHNRVMAGFGRAARERRRQRVGIAVFAQAGR